MRDVLWGRGRDARAAQRADVVPTRRTRRYERVGDERRAACRAAGAVGSGRERLVGILRRLAQDEGDAAPVTDEPEDFSEMGRDLTEEDTARALVADQERLLAQVERALRRMDEGTYGRSEVSGRPIPLERLEALPWATTTVDDPAFNM